MRYDEWLKTWLALYVKQTVKARTHEKYSQIVRLHIKPTIGDNDMDDLTAVMLQKFTADLSQRLSANSVNLIVTVLKRSIGMAEALGICDNNFTDKIVRPKQTEKKIYCFTLAEQKKIERYILQTGKQKLYGIVLCLYSGLRIGELLALEWKDIDFARGILWVNKTCYYAKDDSGKYTRIEDTPKTEQSNRLIPLPKPILLQLKAIKRQAKSKYVVSSGENPMAIRSYQKTFELLLKRLHLEHRGFHALRHTFATRAIESGMDVKTLAEILGHKDATTTLARYAHSLIQHKTEKMNKLAQYCGLKS